MSRLFRTALAGAFLLTAAGCSDRGNRGEAIVPTDPKKAPPLVTAGGGAPAKAKPALPNKGAD